MEVLYQLEEWKSLEKLSRFFLKKYSYSFWVPRVYLFFQNSINELKKEENPDIKFLRRCLNQLEKNDATKLMKELISINSTNKNSLDYFKFKIEALTNKKINNYINFDKTFELLEEIKNHKKLKTLSSYFQENNLIVELFKKREVGILISNHKYKEALGLLNKLTTLYQNRNDIKNLEDLKNLKRLFSINLNVNPYKIGVILPLSSKHSRISSLVKQTIDGLRLALLRSDEYFTSNSSNELNDKIELIFYDSKLSEKETKLAFQKLAENDKVIAVIGPLAKKTSEAASIEAQKWKIPMISLSLTSSVPVGKEYVFRNNQNWKLEIESLIKYAKDYYQAKRFVILYSHKRESILKAEIFKETVESNGGVIVAFEDFEPNQKSFIREFDTFTGKLRELSFKEKKTIEELKEKEDPVRNFDAIFVAIGSQGIKDLKVIFPYAAVYKMDKTLFLGDSGWNHPSLPFMPTYQAFNKLIFSDGYIQEPIGFERNFFFNLHEKIFHNNVNYTKPSSYTAYAYDTLSMLRYLLKDNSNHSHKDLKNALMAIENFPGVTGFLSFNLDGEIQRDMQLLTLENGKIRKLNYE